MDRRKTMTMNFAGLTNNDDEFFETYDRHSEASDDEDFYDAARMSFASTASNVHRNASIMHRNVSSVHRNVSSLHRNQDARLSSAASMSPEYDVWMAAPGSINERRKRLLEGMGLSGDKQRILSFNRVVSRKIPNNSQIPPPQAAAAIAVIKNTDQRSEDASQSEPSHTLVPVLLVRSRSEGEIESFSVEKQRKKEMLGPAVSKQRLSRTASLIAAPRAKRCPYEDPLRSSHPSGGDRPADRSKSMSSAFSNTKFSAFFLIKNLDTGKEFIVNEYDQDGMWNRVNDLQTGKQLTLEEFERCVGHTPVVKELMRREHITSDSRKLVPANSYISKSLRMSKKRGVSMLKSIKGVAHSINLRGEKEKDVLMLQEAKAAKNGSNDWVKVRTIGKSFTELSALHLCQEFQAHEGSIWTIKFSSDTHFLASAGEDKVIHVWEVQECEIMSMSEGNLTPLHPSFCNSPDSALHEKKKKGKSPGSKKGHQAPDYVHVPETVFSLSEKPICSFKGHQDDVLDLSWSRSQQLLSSSMDKTVRLWDLETKSCIKMFAHNDYVTCIHFNPMDDDYFISGSLDAKVRIWSIPGRHVVDWTDLHEMVTAACYSPDGQAAFIGSHKGACRMYTIEDSKLNQLHQIDIQKNKKKAAKKITGFQFSPSNPSEVLVTAANSRIHVLDGPDVIHKFKGFRNTSSQMAASYSIDGKHVICASEDSNVYVWKREDRRHSGTGKKGRISTAAHEHFSCKDVSVAIPWPGIVKGVPPSLFSSTPSRKHSKRIMTQPMSACSSPTQEGSPGLPLHKKGLPPLPKRNHNNVDGAEDLEDPARTSQYEAGRDSVSSDASSLRTSDCSLSSLLKREDISHSMNSTSNFSTSSSIRREDPSSFSSAASSLSNSPSLASTVNSTSSGSSLNSSWGWCEVGGHGNHNVSPTAWGMVIVTATLGGEIRIYQNFGLPRKIGRQGNLF